MENLTKKEFQNSLDLTSDELEKHLPELLKGLWELGSMPEYIIELFDRNKLGKGQEIIDLGCGKGSVLVKLATHFDINAIGVDIVPDFIEEAINYAKKYGVSNKVTFKTEDLRETLLSSSKQDILIYGYDSDVLGDLENTLQQLANGIKTNGHLFLEFMTAEKQTDGMLTAREMNDIINRTDFCILDKIDWNRKILKQTNNQNTKIIRENVKHLISQYPVKKGIFNEYLQNQLEECKEIENDFICTTLLLRNTAVQNVFTHT